MDELKLSPHQSVIIRQSTDELLEVETVYEPGGHAPPKHFHPAQDEHFEVLEGSIAVRVDGEARTLRVGDTIDIPRGSVHDMRVGDDRPARVLWQTRPTGRTEGWFRGIDALHRTGSGRADGTPGPLEFAVMLNEYRDTIRLAAAPDVVVRPVLGVLALIGRARGHSPRSPRT